MSFNNYITTKKRLPDESYMQLALEAAEIAKSRGDIAIGAILVFPNISVSDGHTTFSEHNPIGHAELNVLRKGCQMTTKSFREAILYSTVEPCSMCAIAAYEHGIREIIFGAFDVANGFISSPKSIVPENFNIAYLGGVLAEACYSITTPTIREHLRYQ
jgi:tRNA(adenine34) deaminase